MLREIREMIAQRTRDFIERNRLDVLLIFEKEGEVDQGYTEYVNQFYGKDISQNYHKAYAALKLITKDFAEFPNTESWNKYAKEHGYMSHISLQYVAHLNWKRLQRKVESDLQS